MTIWSNVAAAGAALFLAQSAYAQASKEEPAVFSHEGVLELTWDHVDDSTDVAAATLEYAAAARLDERWTIQGSLVLEPVDEADGDSYFRSEGAYVDTLNVQYAGDAFTLYAGKISPVFGSAAALAPGLYGAEIGESYELVEMIGAGGDVNLAAIVPGLAGEHVLSAALFAKDRSVLSDSIGVSRGRLELADGGAGNTQGLKSYSLSLDGATEAGFGYSLGVRTLAGGIDGGADETAAVIGASYTLDLGSSWNADVFGEVAAVSNADGVRGADRSFYTLSGTVGSGDWRASAIVSGQDDDVILGETRLDRLELSVGRDFADGISLDLGVSFADRNSGDDVTIGVRLTLGLG